MQKKYRLATLLFIRAFAFVFYGLGASFIESFVNYRTWHLIGAAEFRAYHQALWRIIPLMVVPLQIGLLLSLIMILVRPPAVPRWAMIVSVILGVIGAVSTNRLQYPIQVALSEQGLNLALIERLIATDWLRKIPMMLNAALYFWLMTRIARTGSATADQ